MDPIDGIVFCIYISQSQFLYTILVPPVPSCLHLAPATNTVLIKLSMFW